MRFFRSLSHLFLSSSSSSSSTTPRQSCCIVAMSSSSSSSSSSRTGLVLEPPVGTEWRGQAVAEAQQALLQADCVCFDVDSTVLTEEGVDVLADYLGVGKAVAELTQSAMGGDTPFEVALEMRLNLMKPSRTDVTNLLRERPAQLTKGIAELVAALQARDDTDVFLVSGGFRPMIEPVAQQLGIDPHTHVYANTILFHENEPGDYAGFDDTEFTSRDGGKPAVLKELRRKYGYQTMVMIGDGSTDAQAKPPAAAFIGYGGIAVRPSVEAVADWFVTDFDALTEIVRTSHPPNKYKYKYKYK